MSTYDDTGPYDSGPSVTITVSDLVDSTISKLQGTASDELNILGGSLSAQTPNFVDTVPFQYSLGGVVPGAQLSIDDEAMYVLAVNESVGSATVLRGQKGSTAASHTVGAIVDVDPAWPRWVVMSTLRDEIRSWGPQVFQVVSKSITIVAGTVGYDLGYTGPIFERVRVYRDPPPWIAWGGLPSDGYGIPDNQSWPMIPAEIRQDQSPTAFPSGNALIIKSNDLFVPSTVWVVFSAPFDVDTSWTDTTDVIADVGLDPSDIDIPALGAAWRLLSFRQPRRLLTNVADQPRDENAVPPLSLMQAAMQFKQERDSRLNDAQIRLLQRFPIEINVS